MRILDALMVLVGLLGLAGLGWWGVTQLPATATEIEETLQVSAQDELQRAGLGWAQVSLDGQSATIRGTQPNDEIVAEAVGAVLTSSGLGGLVHGGVTTIKTVIDAPPLISPYTWSATRSAAGELTLGGYIPNDEVRVDLMDRASGVTAATVEDEQALGSGVPDGGWQSVAELGLSLLGALDEGEARLTGTRLTVRGSTRDPALRSRAVAELANVSSPFTGRADIRGPGRWSARHFGGELIFTGVVESEDEREEILTIAANHFDGTIVDEMVIGDPRHGGWLDGVRIGLPHFGAFQSGEMAFDPGGTGYRFEGEASGSTLQFLREDLSLLEGPYGVTLAADSVAVEVDELAGVDFSADPRASCEAAFEVVLESNTVVFETGSAAISRESGATLDKLMAVADQCARTLLFELGGHTDATGSAAANRRLSEARAQAVATYMIAAGFDGDRLDVVGYGPDQPIADNTTPEGRAANRRLEFKVLERSE